MRDGCPAIHSQGLYPRPSADRSAWTRGPERRPVVGSHWRRRMGASRPPRRRPPAAISAVIASALLVIISGAVLGETAAAGAIVLALLGIVGWAVWDETRRNRE